MKTHIAITAAISVALSSCGGSSASPNPAPLVAFMGDSITAHWGDASITGTDKTLADLVPNSINAGIGGQTCAQMQTRFATDVISVHPGIVVIDCGTNDTDDYHSTDYQALFDMVIAAQGIGAHVIVGTLPPNSFAYYPTAVAIDSKLHADWNAVIREAAESYGYQVADYYPAMLLPDGQQNLALFYDGLHPDAAGYAIMWRVLEPLLASEGAVTAQ